MKFNAAQDHAECLRVLDEFVSDVEAVEGDDLHESVAQTWPDLWVTYQKARQLVRDDPLEEHDEIVAAIPPVKPDPKVTP